MYFVYHKKSKSIKDLTDSYEEAYEIIETFDRRSFDFDSTSNDYISNLFKEVYDDVLIDMIKLSASPLFAKIPKSKKIKSK